MRSLEDIRETTVSDSGVYEATEAGSREGLEAEVVRLNEELSAEREQVLRLLAEFDNYRRRTKQERAVAEQDGKRELLLALLDLTDDFDRALRHFGESSDAVTNGVRLIRQRFNDVLHAQGVTSFDSEGKPFDPTIHEAMTVIDGHEGESGTVYAEHQRGYLINDELLRPARVAVLK